MTKKFTFLYPVTQPRLDSHRRGGIRFDHVADFKVNGVVNLDTLGKPGKTSFVNYKIENILFNELDVYPLVHAFSALHEVEAACVNHLESLFSSKTVTSTTPVYPLHSNKAKLVSFPSNLKVEQN